MKEGLKCAKCLIGPRNKDKSKMAAQDQSCYVLDKEPVYGQQTGKDFLSVGFGDPLIMSQIAPVPGNSLTWFIFATCLLFMCMHVDRVLIKQS